MKKNKFRSIFLILIFLFAQSCDILKKDGGSFNIKFIWEQGEEPSEDESENLYVWAVLNEWKNGNQNESLEISIAGPVTLASKEALEFENLSYGSDRVIIIEIRDVSSREKSDNILYFGRSDLFELKEGENTSVSVTMKLQKTFNDSEGLNIIEIMKKGTLTPVEYTNDNIVDLKIVAGKASKIVISNNSGFDKGTTEIMTEKLLATEEDGVFIYEGWDIDKDLGDGVRNVYVELFNELGYGSGIKQDSVIFDITAPNTVSRSIMPETLKKEGIANISVIFDEPVTDVEIVSELELLEDESNESEKTWFKWSYTENNDAEKTFSVLVKATDLAGNMSEIEVGNISIDRTAPSLKSFVPVNIFVTPGKSVDIEFELNEENDGIPEIQIGSYTLLSEECSNDGLKYVCSHVEPDGKLDKDGKTEAGLDPVELDGEKKVSVSLTDLAGNSFEALLGTAVYDRIAPVVNGSVITPTNAKGGSLILFSISFNEYISNFDLDSGDLEFEPCTSDDQYQFLCKYIVKGDETEGEYIIKTTVTDKAGNMSDPTPATPFSIDLTGPEISVEDVSVVTDTGILSDDNIHKAKGGSVVTVSFTVSSSEELAGMPEVIIDNANAFFISFEDDKYIYSHTVESVVSTDGKKSVILRTYDEAGNPGVINIGSVIYDFTPPRIVDFSLKRSPELLSAIDSENNRTYFSINDPISGEYVSASITAYADETIVNPEIEIIGLGNKPVFGRDTFSAKKADFSTILDNSIDSGEYGFKLIWEDELGNSNRDDLSEISMKMVVDKSVPDISATDFSKITYHRLPFGEKNDPSTRFFVEGDEGSVESERLVYLFNTPYEPSRTSFAGSISPESDGSFLIDTREVGNSPYMFLRIGNKAGNLSEPERIRLNKWTGTLKGKIPGSSAENGIEYGKRVLKIDSLKNSGELMKYLENFEDVQKISDSDAVFLSTGNDSGLKLDSHNPDELPILENSNFIVDPVRNQIFVLNFPDETSQIDIYSVDVSSKTLKPLGYIGVSPNPRNGFNLLYNYYDNSIFFAGGSISGTNMDDVWEFDPDTLEWKQITPDWSQIDPWVEDGTKTGAFSVPKAWASFIDVINYDIEEHKLYYFRFADGSYAGNHLNGVAVYDVRYKIWSSFIQDSTPIPYPDMYGFDVSSGFYDVSESKICFAGRKKIYRMNSFTGVWDVVDLTPVAFTSVLGFDSIRRNLILSNYAQVKSYNLDTQEEKPVKDFGAFYPEKFDYLSMSDNFYFIDDNEIVKEVSASDFTVSDAMKVPLYSAIPSKTDGNPVYFYSDINDALYVYMGYYTNQHYRQLWKFSFEDEKWTNLEPESQVYTSQPPSLDSKTIFYRKSTGRITVAGPYWASKSYFYEFNEATEQMKWSEVLLGTDPAPSGTYEAVAVDNVNEIYYFLVCVLNNQDCTVHSFNDINKSWSNLGIGIAEKSSYYQMQYIPGYSYLIVNASAADEYDVNKTLIYDVAGSTLLKTLTLDDSPENIRTLSYVDFSEKLLSVQTDVYNGTVWSFNFDSLEWEKKEKTTAITANYNEGIFLFERKTPQSEIFLINKINKLMNFDYGFTSRTENILELPLPVIYNDRNNSNPDIISSLTVSAISKGFSYNDNKEKIEGVELSVWNKEKWGVVDQNNAGAEEIDPSLMELNFTFDNRIDIKRLFDHGEKSLFVKMSPYGIVGKNGKLDVDFIQIEVEYSLPE